MQIDQLNMPCTDGDPVLSRVTRRPGPWFALIWMPFLLIAPVVDAIATSDVARLVALVVLGAAFVVAVVMPFRSWGRSLVGDNKVPPFVVRYSANLYQFMCGNYICTFDGQKAVGFYAADDRGMKHNLINSRNAEMNGIELRCKAFLQDYMERVIDKKLNSHT